MQTDLGPYLETFNGDARPQHGATDTYQVFKKRVQKPGAEVGINQL